MKERRGRQLERLSWKKKERKTRATATGVRKANVEVRGLLQTTKKRCRAGVQIPQMVGQMRDLEDCAE